ncbi:hypothetical protein SG34_027155 [Thalassomonas viridans]|uniref:Uncharacterized protein n=1 Tax=Thalassomonas viridans TaxID=137584 RepID=A0AAE9Z176_9GAMM|nr:hypothetical protein [Thalassomonas viridans]WDE04941.1 hypothetical protein SG34_027155 [Thalassomonas viridans]
MELFKYPGVGRSGHFCKGHYLFCNFGYQYLACKPIDKPDDPLLGLPVMSCYACEHFARRFLTTLHQWKNPLDIICRLMRYMLCDEYSLSRFNEAQAIDYLVERLLNRDLLIFEMDEPKITYSGYGEYEPGSSKNNRLILEEVSLREEVSSGESSRKVAATPANNDSASSSVRPGNYRVSTEFVNKEPTSLEEVRQRLEQARERLITTGEYKPKYSQEELEALVVQGILSARFLVTLQEKEAGDNPVGFKRGSGRTTTWTTTFDQMENGDTDPRLLNDLNGMSWDEEAEWEIIILDREKYFEQGSGLTFIPTYENTAALGGNEFSDEFSKEVLQMVMSPEYSRKYADAISDYKAKGGQLYNPQQIKKYAATRFIQVDERNAFKARHTYTVELGTNEHFSGDGLTKTTGESGYLAKGQHGALEIIIFEKSPKTMDELEADGAILRIPAKPIT